MAKTRITWRKEPPAEGLARASAPPRGRLVKINGVDAGGVFAAPNGWMDWKGWAWSVRAPGVPLKNTSSKPIENIEDAQAECEAYIRACLEPQ